MFFSVCVGAEPTFCHVNLFCDVIRVDKVWMNSFRDNYVHVAKQSMLKFRYILINIALCSVCSCVML